MAREKLGADDDPADLTAVRELVDAAVADGDVLLAAVEAHTDEGLRAAVELRRRHPGTGVVLFSQYIETRYASELLAGGAAGVGYLLKDRSPTSPSSPMRWPGSPRAAGLAALTPRERDVFALMAEGRSNAGIAAAMVVSAGVVEKHVASIFGKLNLPPTEADNRRVLAVLRYLGS
jgi:DNA-binding NarL/FixJ family response regulator